MTQANTVIERSPINTQVVDTVRGEIKINFGDNIMVTVARGKLDLCVCTDFEWECETQGEDTVCFQKCNQWSCTEVPAGLLSKIVNVLTGQ